MKTGLRWFLYKLRISSNVCTRLSVGEKPRTRLIDTVEDKTVETSLRIKTLSKKERPPLIEKKKKHFRPSNDIEVRFVETITWLKL